MQNTSKILRSALILFVFLPMASAKQTDDPVSAFPNDWSGVFRWHEQYGDQHVTVRIDRILLDGKHLSATGKGYYLIGKDKTDIQVEWSVDVETRFIEMWDANPTGDDTGYITDGSYVGTISRDFQSIHAIWRTHGTNETGTIILQAVDQNKP